MAAALHGRLGIWSSGLRTCGLAEAAAAAAELEALGYAAVWLPGRGHEDVEERVAALLDATERLVVATGILSIWAHPADAVAAMCKRLAERYPGRFLLGLGVSHAPLVDTRGGRYERPLSHMRAYLDALDAAGPAAGSGRRVLAALAPRMLALAAERSLGSHPYLVTPEQTAAMRAAVGPRVLLAPEQKVVLEEDRATARAALDLYFRLPNYVESLRRGGLDVAELPDAPSDALVDALVATGSDGAVARLRAHLDAGADHVAVQVLARDGRALPREGWRTLAGLVPTNWLAAPA